MFSLHGLNKVFSFQTRRQETTTNKSDMFFLCFSSAMIEPCFTVKQSSTKTEARFREAHVMNPMN